MIDYWEHLQLLINFQMYTYIASSVSVKQIKLWLVKLLFDCAFRESTKSQEIQRRIFDSLFIFFRKASVF